MHALKQFWALLRQRCPRCRRGKIFKGLFTMNDPCPVCGLVFEREPGYYLGAMYFSYPIGVVVLGAFYYLAAWMFPHWDSQMMVLAILVPYVPLMPIVFRYSRVIWIHYDRWASPSEVSNHEGWAKWRELKEWQAGSRR